MRISTRMGYSSFNNNISRLQEQTYFNLLRKSTGKDIQCIADAPTRLMDSKKLIAQKNMKENYIFHNEYAVNEMRSGEDVAKAIADDFQKIRELSINSTNVSIDGTVSALAVYIRGIVTDIVRNANTDFNGKYMFSGTMTTPNSIENANPGMTNMPYEFIMDENTRKFEVVFKGNNDVRTINKDGHSNEVINMTSEQLFGAGGIDYFAPIIEIYDILMFKPDGSGDIREPFDYLTRDEVQRVADLQSVIALNIEKIDNETAMYAARRERIDAVNLQMVEEVVRLKEVNSLKEDVDMPKLLTQLAQEENALQYSLSAGASINKYSLFQYI